MGRKKRLKFINENAKRKRVHCPEREASSLARCICDALNKGTRLRFAFLFPLAFELRPLRRIFQQP